MSVYNEPVSLVEKAINSILKQTYSNFEFIIIVDNPSNTELVTFLDNIKLVDSRIKLYVNPINIGLTKSLNIGLQYCSGKYIARMDADDVSMPQRFEKQYLFLEGHPDVVACGSHFKLIDENDNEIGNVCLETSSESILHNLLFQTPFCHPATMVLRKIDGQPIKYDENLRYSQDYGLWASLGLFSKFANIPEFLFCYRVSSNQVSFKRKEEQQQCHISVQRKLIRDLGLVLSELDENIILNLLNQRNNIYSCKEIESAIVHFITNNEANRRINKNHNQKVLLKNYANYLSMHFPLTKSLFRMGSLSFKLKYFSFSSLMSLVNKYRLKLISSENNE